MMKIGLIVNPVAGLGGSVGLKGSDGLSIQEEARRLGAKPKSNLRAKQALEEITDLKDKIEIVTYPGEMGENLGKELGFKILVLGSTEKGVTSETDTIKAAKECLDNGVSLIVFAGGDGTARNIFQAVGNKVPVLGIPAGVKIHSAVYSTTPKAGGELLRLFIEGAEIEIKEAEVMDIDEEKFRQGSVTAKLFGYLKIPYEKRYMQDAKTGSVFSESASLDDIGAYVIEEMDEDTLYLIGPGTTTREIIGQLGGKNTLLGVDLVYNKKVIKNDVIESDILEALKVYPRRKIVVTIIGGQGYVFGRGNQQISSVVLKEIGKENIMIVSTLGKLKENHGNPLIVDTGDSEVDTYLKGYYRVIVGYGDIQMYKIG